MDETTADSKPGRSRPDQSIVDKSSFAVRPPRPHSSAMHYARVVSPADAFALFGELAGRAREHLWSAALDPRGGVLAMRRGGPGDACSASLPVGPLLREALACGAWGLIVAHNHPAGEAVPSPQDIRATRRLAEGAGALGLHLLDHVVVARGEWASFRLLGLL
jgi:DNA repair protein RadC